MMAATIFVVAPPILVFKFKLQRSATKSHDLSLWEDCHFKGRWGVSRAAALHRRGPRRFTRCWRGAATRSGLHRPI